MFIKKKGVLAMVRNHRNLENHKGPWVQMKDVYALTKMMIVVY